MEQNPPQYSPVPFRNSQDGRSEELNAGIILDSSFTGSGPMKQEISGSGNTVTSDGQIKKQHFETKPLSISDSEGIAINYGAGAFQEQNNAPGGEIHRREAIPNQRGFTHQNNAPFAVFNSVGGSSFESDAVPQQCYSQPQLSRSKGIAINYGRGAIQQQSNAPQGKINNPRSDDNSGVGN